MLIRATSTGDDESPPQARLLLERYPAAALTPIIQDARQAQVAWIREELVALTGQGTAAGPAEFLLEELRRGPFLATRVAAAIGLKRRGRPEAVSAMIREWQQGPPKQPGSMVDVAKLTSFLLGSGDAQAVEALGRTLSRWPVDVRIEVVSAFRNDGSRSDLGRGSGSAGSSLSPAAEAAIERLLVELLDDTEKRNGMSGSWNKLSFVDPRIGDLQYPPGAQRRSPL